MTSPCSLAREVLQFVKKEDDKKKEKDEDDQSEDHSDGEDHSDDNSNKPPNAFGIRGGGCLRTGSSSSVRALQAQIETMFAEQSRGLTSERLNVFFSKETIWGARKGSHDVLLVAAANGTFGKSLGATAFSVR